MYDKYHYEPESEAIGPGELEKQTSQFISNIFLRVLHKYWCAYNHAAV